LFHSSWGISELQIIPHLLALLFIAIIAHLSILNDDELQSVCHMGQILLVPTLPQSQRIILGHYSLFSTVCLLAGGKVGKLEMWRTGGLEVSIPLMCPFTLSFPYEGFIFYASSWSANRPRLQA